jgi:general secretion pathway protein K
MRHKRGFILVVVLVMTVVIASYVTHAQYAAMTDIRSAGSVRDRQQALAGARSGIEAALQVLENEKNPAFVDLNGMWAQPFAVSAGNGKMVRVSINHENGRINLNSLAARGANRSVRLDQILLLCDVAGFSYGIIPAIIDWIDTDDDVSSLESVRHDNKGAENDYYMELDQPYPCRNGTLDMISELAPVRGITVDMLTRSSGSQSLFADSVTTFGGDTVNINTAPLNVLRTLDVRIDESMAEDIDRERRLKPLRTLDNLMDIPGMSQDILDVMAKVVHVREDVSFFSITSEAACNERLVRIEAVFRRDNANATVTGPLYWVES